MGNDAELHVDGGIRIPLVKWEHIVVRGPGF